MEFAWLEDFLALVDCANFSRAAETRHVTQPAFSRRIRALEDWIGAPLFDRDAQPVKLTAAGERFRPRADELLRRLLQAREEAQQTENLAAATLRFAATHALSLTFFPTWLRALEAGGQIGAIRLVSDTLQACETLMLGGQAQFLLCHFCPGSDERLDPTQFQSLRVGRDVLAPMSAPKEDGTPRWALSRGKTPDPNLPHLAYSAESGMGRILRAASRVPGGRTAPALRAVFTSHLAAVLKTMTQAGRGLAWLPLSLVGEELASGSLVRAGDKTWDVAVEIRLFRPASRLSPAAEKFWARLGREPDSSGDF